MFKFLWKLIKGIFLLLILLVVIFFLYTFLKPEEKETYREVNWPDSELAAMIPEVGSDGTFIGEVVTDTASHLSITVANATGSDFDSYVSKCKEKGFVVDYSASSSSYRADNETGHSIRVYYDEDDETFDVSINTPDKKKSSKKKKNKAAVTESESDVPVSADTTDETQAAETVSQESQQATVSDDQIRPEFKEAMDSYEAFFDEYIDFMKKYQESGSSLEMAVDYANYLAKYTDTMSKMEALDDGDLTIAETSYYVEVTGRITQKLLEVADMNQ